VYYLSTFLYAIINPIDQILSIHLDAVLTHLSLSIHDISIEDDRMAYSAVYFPLVSGHQQECREPSGIVVETGGILGSIKHIGDTWLLYLDDRNYTVELSLDRGPVLMERGAGGASFGGNDH